MGARCCKPEMEARQNTSSLGRQEEKSLHGYEILGQIGEGCYGRVMKGVKGDQLVVIKVVEKRYLLDERDALEEVEILKTAEHPNVVRFIEFIEEADRFIIVLENLEGGELFDRVAMVGNFVEDDARKVMKSLLDVLAYMHARDVVHRDIKPENLFLVDPHDSTNIKVADFGHARRLDGFKETRCRGNPGTLAPEMLLREPYGTQVDMWSAGCVMFVLLGGYEPFYDRSARNLVRKVRSL
uniref:Protein kinase domain-containing protein n=2 Tax=Phaeomonas parva TaxID=124430 RepID=A0A7S1TY37_9STRA|mmetsp:Transcript_20134/g.61080  ORF Transcript_20134/g.61080 Transcript_20134/m.61080 type:complete len:240 (+) Transcript_20134:268-987(+)